MSPNSFMLVFWYVTPKFYMFFFCSVCLLKLRATGFFTRNRRVNTKFEINRFVYYLQPFRLHEVVQFSITDRIKVLKSVHLTFGVQKLHFSIFGRFNRVFTTKPGFNTRGNRPKRLIMPGWYVWPGRTGFFCNFPVHATRAKQKNWNSVFTIIKLP